MSDHAIVFLVGEQGFRWRPGHVTLTDAQAEQLAALGLDDRISLDPVVDCQRFEGWNFLTDADCHPVPLAAVAILRSAWKDLDWSIKIREVEIRNLPPHRAR